VDLAADRVAGILVLHFAQPPSRIVRLTVDHITNRAAPPQLRLGIDPRADRNTALLQLAAELPIPVVADLLGLHIGTAAKWADYANAAHTGYAAARASRH